MSNLERPSPRRAPSPIDGVLQDPVREASIPRMWRTISARRHAPVPSSRLSWPLVAFVATLCVLLVGRALLSQRAVVPSAVNGPLLRTDGVGLVAMEAPQHGPPARVDFVDHSRIVVEPGARVEPLASSAREFTVLLVRGAATFDVRPGGPRRWTVEAGIAQIEVVGTRFSVERRNDRVRVVVEHGTVLVRSARLPDVLKVEAGDSVEVPATPAPSPAPIPGSAPAANAASVKSSEPSRNATSSSSPPSAASATPSWREAARTGKHIQAYELLGAAGLRQETARAASGDDLFALADIARLSGHPEAAVEALERLLRQHPSSNSAPLARVTLGRVQLGLGNAVSAAQAFEQALNRGAPAGLEEDVTARLAEAYFRAGNRAAATRAVETYERRFPQGHYRERLQRFK